MALVFGKSHFSAAPRGELNVSYTDYKGGAAGEDSDDEEYVYVSRLAEQIAAHAMLDEEEEDPCSAASSAMECNDEEMGFSSYANEVKLQKGRQVQDGDYSVSHFAAAWRDYGPTEWDCFYTPIPHPQSANQATSFHLSQLDQFYKIHGWSSLRQVHHKQARPNAVETHVPSEPSTLTFSHDSSIQKRKETVGTGVFLPKIVNTGSSHYRRKGGLSVRSSYASRSKF